MQTPDTRQNESETKTSTSRRVFLLKVVSATTVAGALLGCDVKKDKNPKTGQTGGTGPGGTDLPVIKVDNINLNPVGSQPMQSVNSGGGGGSLGGGGSTGPVSEAPKWVYLSDSDAMSQAYTEDSNKVAAGRYTNHFRGALCGNCRNYLGTSGTARGPCSVFGGRLVASTGWCTSFAPKVAKPAASTTE